MTRKQDSARIRWVFRQSATDDEDEAWALHAKFLEHCTAAAFQLESAPDTGYLHYQGSFWLINRKRFQWIQKELGHFEYLQPQKGTPLQAWTYGTKQETRVIGPWLLGECPVEGTRSDLKDYVESCKANKSDIELWNEHPTCMARYPGVPGKIRGLEPPIRKNGLQVLVFYGSPGLGKSTFARRCFPGIYDIPISDKLWLTDRAYGKEMILFEDFAGEMPLKRLNRMLDPFPLEMEVKNGWVWYMPSVIVFTCNDPPHEWYDYSRRRDLKAQIYRRITWVINFNDHHKKMSCKDLEESLRPPQRQLVDALVMPRLAGIELHQYPMPERFPRMIPDPLAPISWNEYGRNCK